MRSRFSDDDPVFAKRVPSPVMDASSTNQSCSTWSGRSSSSTMAANALPRRGISWAGGVHGQSRPLEQTRVYQIDAPPLALSSVEFTPNQSVLRPINQNITNSVSKPTAQTGLRGTFLPGALMTSMLQKNRITATNPVPAAVSVQHNPSLPESSIQFQRHSLPQQQVNVSVSAVGLHRDDSKTQKNSQTTAPHGGSAQPGPLASEITVLNVPERANIVLTDGSSLGIDGVRAADEDGYVAAKARDLDVGDVEADPRQEVFEDQNVAPNLTFVSIPRPMPAKSAPPSSGFGPSLPTVDPATIARAGLRHAMLGISPPRGAGGMWGAAKSGKAPLSRTLASLQQSSVAQQRAAEGTERLQHKTDEEEVGRRLAELAVEEALKRAICLSLPMQPVFAQAHSEGAARNNRGEPLSVPQAARLVVDETQETAHGPALSSVRDLPAAVQSQDLQLPAPLSTLATGSESAMPLPVGPVGKKGKKGKGSTKEARDAPKQQTNGAKETPSAIVAAVETGAKQHRTPDLADTAGEGRKRRRRAGSVASDREGDRRQTKSAHVAVVEGSRIATISSPAPSRVSIDWEAHPSQGGHEQRRPEATAMVDVSGQVDDLAGSGMHGQQQECLEATAMVDVSAQVDDLAGSGMHGQQQEHPEATAMVDVSAQVDDLAGSVMHGQQQERPEATAMVDVSAQCGLPVEDEAQTTPGLWTQHARTVAITAGLDGHQPAGAVPTPTDVPVAAAAPAPAPAHVQVQVQPHPGPYPANPYTALPHSHPYLPLGYAYPSWPAIYSYGGYPAPPTALAYMWPGQGMGMGMQGMGQPWQAVAGAMGLGLPPVPVVPQQQPAQQAMHVYHHYEQEVKVAGQAPALPLPLPAPAGPHLQAAGHRQQMEAEQQGIEQEHEQQETAVAHGAAAPFHEPCPLYREAEATASHTSRSSPARPLPVSLPVPRVSCLTTLAPPGPEQEAASVQISEVATQPLPPVIATPAVEEEVGAGAWEQSGEQPMDDQGQQQDIDYGLQDEQAPPLSLAPGSPGPASGIPTWLEELVSDANSDVSRCSSRARAAAALAATHGPLDQDHLQIAPFAFHLLAVRQGSVSWGEPETEAHPLAEGALAVGAAGGAISWAGARYKLLHPLVGQEGQASIPSVLCTLTAPPGGSPHAVSAKPAGLLNQRAQGRGKVKKVRAKKL